MKQAKASSYWGRLHTMGLVSNIFHPTLNRLGCGAPFGTSSTKGAMDMPSLTITADQAN
jgi:hypothetical protein